MPSNRRRSHVHLIKQYKNESEEYTGTRIVVFIKDRGMKYILDLDNFYIHKYQRPKDKKHSISKWRNVSCPIEEVNRKQMINESICKRYKMIHTLYESSKRTVEDYLQEVLEQEEIYLTKNQIDIITDKTKK